MVSLRESRCDKAKKVLVNLRLTVRWKGKGCWISLYHQIIMRLILTMLVDEMPCGSDLFHVERGAKISLFQTRTCG